MLSAGTRLGPYDIVAPLGAGGMGEVYRARDTKLNRDVAIKVLLPAVANDPDRLARFSREAQVLASLNHPNIAHIHGLEETGGVTALILELVEGEDLAQRIARGPIPLDEALPIARQIADALEAAHEQGIIHRDLKPANIKVRPDGTVKVLDFGLAKAMDPSGGSSANAMNSPTLSMHATQAGIILGTAAYMSPEQARGKTVDTRADIWAFGAVLFEMLTGTRAFDAEDISATLAFVITKEPEWSALPGTTPAAIRRLVRRCLEKDPKRRLQAVGDARLEIEEALTAPLVEPSSTAAAPAAPRGARTLPIAIALAGGALAAALATWILVQPAASTPAPVMRTTVTPPSTLPLTPSTYGHDVAIAPDGSFLVYRSARGQLVVRRLDRLDASPVPGVINARSPFVSPDSRWIGYIENDIVLKKVAVAGGSAITLARLSVIPLGACWVDDATIVIAAAQGLRRVSAGGGEPTVLTTLDPTHDERSHVFPSALPGGRALLFTVTVRGTAGKIGNSQIALLDLQTGQRTTLIRGGSDAQYVASGHLIYAAGGGLSAVRFDLARRASVGDPVPVLDGVVAVGGGVNAAATRAGTLVYVPGTASVEVSRSLVWVDRKGHEEPIPAPLRRYRTARLSPDGTRVAVDIVDQESDVWVWDLARQTLARLTFDPAMDEAPVWTADGRRIVFTSNRAGALNLYVRAADGTGADVRLTTSLNTQIPNSVTPDGSFVIGYERRTQAETGAAMVRVPLGADASGQGAGTSAVEGLLETRFEELNGEVSPDGHFLAYESNESGRAEIYVRPYPKLGDGRWQVSTSGGTRPAWTRRGRELVYLDGATRLTTVAVETTGATFREGPSVTLSTTDYATPNFYRSYDVSPDGQRFLMIKEGAGSTDTAPPPSIVVVQNWFEELKRLLPAK